MKNFKYPSDAPSRGTSPRHMTKTLLLVLTTLSIMSWRQLPGLLDRPFFDYPRYVVRLPKRIRRGPQRRGNLTNHFILTGDRPREKVIHVVGERHTGVDFMVQHLEACFGQFGIKVDPGHTRKKYWFQEDDAIDTFHDIHVISMTRNPYDWIIDMRNNPQHSPYHFNLTWQEFVSKPWTMPRVGEDLDIEGINHMIMDEKNAEDNYNTSWLSYSFASVNCNEDFSPWQVIPCLERRKYKVEGGFFVRPVYELQRNGSGQPYKSVMHLRRDKVLNHNQEMRKFPGITHFQVVPLEDIMRNGTANLLRELSNILLEKVLNVTGNEMSDKNSTNNGGLPCKPLKPMEKSMKRELNPEMIRWANENVDWDVEALIGYTPQNSSFSGLRFTVADS